MWITNVVVKLQRLVLQVEMSWYHSLVLSVGQYFVTLLSELESCRLNISVLYASTWSKYPLVQGNPLAVLGCQL